MAINYKSNCPDLGLKSVKIRLLLTLGHLNCISQSGIPQLKRHDGKQSSRVVVVHPEHGNNVAVRAATTCLRFNGLCTFWCCCRSSSQSPTFGSHLCHGPVMLSDNNVLPLHTGGWFGRGRKLPRTFVSHTEQSGVMPQCQCVRNWCQS